MMEDSYMNYNHASYGTTPRSVIKAQRELIDKAEANPDRWFRDIDGGGYKTLFEQARKALSDYLHTPDSSSLVLIENASSGMNAILRSLAPLEKGDEVLYLSCAYHMVKNVLKYLEEVYEVKLVEVEISWPIEGPDGIIKPVSEALREHPNIKLCTFSHIVSVPAVILPIEGLARICKEAGVKVIVDGAHALGAIDIDLTAFEAAGVDFYVANGHKWLYSPKGSAIMWCRSALQKEIVPTVISSEAGNSNEEFVQLFEYTGTRDYTPMIGMLNAMQFRDNFGDKAIKAYIHSLAVDAAEFLKNLWGTECICPASMVSTMINVRLPTNSRDVATSLNDRLNEKVNTYIVVYETAGGVWWTRLSAQIWMELSDFKELGHLVLEVIPGTSKNGIM